MRSEYAAPRSPVNGQPGGRLDHVPPVLWVKRRDRSALLGFVLLQFWIKRDSSVVFGGSQFDVGTRRAPL